MMLSRVPKKMFWFVPEVKAREQKDANMLGSWYDWTQELFVIGTLIRLSIGSWFINMGSVVQ